MPAYQNRDIGPMGSQLSTASDTRINHPDNGLHINADGIDATGLALTWTPHTNIRRDITAIHSIFPTLSAAALPRCGNTFTLKSTLQFF